MKQGLPLLDQTFKSLLLRFELIHAENHDYNRDAKL